VRQVTGDSFGADVLGAEVPVVVDFWAPWCGPCKAVARILEELASDQAGRAEFVQLNVDEHPEVAARYSVLSLPTTVLFAGGEARATVVGARRRGHYERVFGAWLT
jgi:thioredoxin 1